MFDLMQRQVDGARRRHRAVLVAVTVTLAALLLGGCTDDSAPDPSVEQPLALVGRPVGSAVCPVRLPADASDATEVPSEIDVVLICPPRPFNDRSTPLVRVDPESDFVREQLMIAVTDPHDDRASTCVGVPQAGLWVRAEGDLYELRIPIYGCGQQAPRPMRAIWRLIRSEQERS